MRDREIQVVRKDSIVDEQNDNLRSQVAQMFREQRLISGESRQPQAIMYLPDCVIVDLETHTSSGKNGAPAAYEKRAAEEKKDTTISVVPDGLAKRKTHTDGSVEVVTLNPITGHNDSVRSWKNGDVLTKTAKETIFRDHKTGEENRYLKGFEPVVKPWK